VTAACLPLDGFAELQWEGTLTTDACKLTRLRFGVASGFGLILAVGMLTGCSESRPKVMMPENPVPPPPKGALKQHTMGGDEMQQALPAPQQQPQP
jgi:hypothetical protein